MASEPTESLSVENGFEEPATQDKSGKGIWGGLGVLGVLLTKFWSVALLFLAKLKFLLVIFKFKTMLSMLLMIWFESMRFGPVFGIGFVLLMLVNELGHFGAAKMLGLDVSSPLFIPFVGALIAMKETPQDVEVEAKVAIAGPIVGSLGALVCLGLYFATQERLFLSLT